MKAIHGGKTISKANRLGIAERFTDEVVCQNVQLNLDLLDVLDERIRQPELYLVRRAKVHDPHAFHLLRSVPCIGKVLALTILYEVQDVRRREAFELERFLAET